MRTVRLPYGFYPRSYQIEPWNAILDDNFQRGVLVVPRRNGKDILCWNAMIAKAMQVVGLYYYVAPYYNQVRQIIWEGFDDTGRRFIDYIPNEIIANKTKLDMRIDLINGSQIKLQGSDEINRIVGTNPRGIVFTEYSLHKPLAWEYLRPILANNGGWAVFNGTPRGMNHLYDVHMMAERNADWYSQYLTRDHTGIPTLQAIQADRLAGMPEELIQQEYYCSWLSGNVGAYYATQIQALRDCGRITSVPWEPKLPVHTCWDIGVNDPSAIWFFQLYGHDIHWIDYYSSRGVGLPHYIKILKEKPYVYGTHIAPWDMEVTEWGSGLTRKETAYEDYGIEFLPMPKLAFDDGIEAARAILPRSRFDENKCHDGLMGLTHYRATTKGQNKTLSIGKSPDPEHDWASHPSDAFRYGAIGILGDYISNEKRVMIPRTIRSIGSIDQTMSQQLQNILNLLAIKGQVNMPGMFTNDDDAFIRGVLRNTPIPQTIRAYNGLQSGTA